MGFQGILTAAGRRRGLVLAVAAAPSIDAPIVERLTEEAAVVPLPGATPRVEILAAEGEVVAAGAPVARLRHDPGIRFVAPMAARVARVRLLPGHRLGEIVLFRERGGDAVSLPVPKDAEAEAETLSTLLHSAGFWPRIRRRPFGAMPLGSERPTAIVVMACDSRPLAPDPVRGLAGREEALARGLGALKALTAGPVFLCQAAGAPVLTARDAGPQVLVVTVGPRHPQGLAGIRVHDLCPAEIDRPVWDVDAEDVADLGDLLATGTLPQTRIVSVAGDAMTEPRLLRCQIGANTRGLCYGGTRPGSHLVLAGSPLDGWPSHWLGPRDRQVSVMVDRPPPADRHWFLSALMRTSRPRPLIPSAALVQATGGAFPAMAMLRALAAGDDETAIRLGALSLIEEDLALVDYVIGGAPRVTDRLRALLDRAEAEAAP
ncbi:Na(+)-translocating NADH-quinone reductase subunit A [Rhodobacterales bacterium HKCCE3408]|nr:Na(+)-translocating NADH-quinone reductase subunit A [Rhodobacterales bacterium HKCCE3408]